MRGFTLLEILISISLLSFISVVTGQSIHQALENKRKIQKKIDIISEAESALNLIAEDVKKAFHYKDPFSSVFGKNSLPSKNLTYFKGGEKELSLSSLNYPQIAKKSSFSEQALVSYYIESCKSMHSKENSNCLKRKISPYLTQEISKIENSSVLLEGVTSLSFKYLLSSGKWSKSWDSTEETKGSFPLAVQIMLEVNNPAHKDFPKMTIGTFSKLQFTNNEQDFESNTSDPYSLSAEADKKSESDEKSFQNDEIEKNLRDETSPIQIEGEN